MANLFERYGIKEVSDVTFYGEGAEGDLTVPVLYLDTLKISTVETTAENTEAKGGKGNGTFIAWDYGKEVIVNLEDALFSTKSMEVMYGGKYNSRTSEKLNKIKYFNVKKYKEIPFFKATVTGTGQNQVKTWAFNKEKVNDFGLPWVTIGGQVITPSPIKENVAITTRNNGSIMGEDGYQFFGSAEIETDYPKSHFTKKELEDNLQYSNINAGGGFLLPPDTTIKLSVKEGSEYYVIEISVTYSSNVMGDTKIINFQVESKETLTKIIEPDYVGLSIKENRATFTGKSYVVIEGIKVPLNGTSTELEEALNLTSFKDSLSSATELKLNEGFVLFAVDGDADNQDDNADLFDVREIEISSNSFPGVYKVTGDTFVRNESTGKDEFFQIVFPKVKILSESNTITMEAEGDPTVFNMSLKALKPKSGPLMELIQYTPEEDE